nr:MAG TPA: hypothetical protein [Ackermannviridae sp.]
MSATAFNMGATAGKVLIDMSTGRDLGGTGREEVMEYSWTAPTKCSVFTFANTYSSKDTTAKVVVNGQKIDQQVLQRNGLYSNLVAAFTARSGDSITVYTDLGRNAQSIYLYAITI